MRQPTDKLWTFYGQATVKRLKAFVSEINSLKTKMKTMSSEQNDENLNFELEIKELVKQVAEKAQKESMTTTKNAWGNYIEENSDLKSKTFLRMYDRYILANENKPIPITHSLNSAAEFIGYSNFADFCNKKCPNEREEVNELEIGIPKVESVDSIKTKQKLRKVIYGLGITTILSVGSYFGIGAVNQPQCMYWNENHYEVTKCDENLHPNASVIPIDEQKLRHFKKIEVSDTTTFFEAGKAIVWYVKVDGEPEFFSADGIHPINGRELKKVSPHIIDKYVLNK